jgi:PHD/YefM family antitoxin component YafN of YafNO toxin-antitoxin module
MDEPTVLPFPVAGEITEVTWRQIAEGQPVLLLRDGRPAAVIVDLGSWEEAEFAISDLESGERAAPAISQTA